MGYDHVVDAWEYNRRQNSKFVCENCLDSIEGLRKIVREKGKHHKCAFCGATTKCVKIMDIVDLVKETLNDYFDRAVNGCPYDGREGGYQGVTYDKEEALEELGLQFLENNNVYQAISDEIEDDTWWHESEFYDVLDEKEELYNLWLKFCDLIKHHVRFIFFLIEDKICINDPTDIFDEYNHGSPQDILKLIAGIVERLDLTIYAEEDSIFYRGVTHSEEVLSPLPDRITSPPDDKASANRMSAAGISVFYGADSADTVIAELQKDKAFATIVQFKSLRKLKILDLTKIESISIPDNFDIKRNERDSIIFLKSLEKTLRKPINNIDLERNIEYVPMQVFAEYFRHIKKYDGIKYSSVKQNNGACYALFFNQEDCMPSKRKDKEQVLKMVDRSAISYCLYNWVKLT